MDFFYISKIKLMKRLLILLIFVLGISHISFGQLKTGIKAGVNICDFIVTSTGDNFSNESFNTKVSYNFGTYVQHSFSEQFGWRVEVLFSNKGYKQKFEDHTTNVSLNYLNLPVLLVYRPINSLEFELGPEFGYLVSGESLVNSFDFGLNIGARYNISSRFNFGLRYNNGFPFKMNIDEFSNNDVTPKYSNSVIQFYLGFNLTNELKESP